MCGRATGGMKNGGRQMIERKMKKSKKKHSQRATQSTKKKKFESKKISLLRSIDGRQCNRSFAPIDSLAHTKSETFACNQERED